MILDTAIDVITFAYYDSPIGVLKIGGTDLYISQISFAENETNPEQQSTETPAIIHDCIEQLIEYFAGNRQTFDLPIHQDGTEFQEKVWGKLSEIPFGSTMSFKTIIPVTDILESYDFGTITGSYTNAMQVALQSANIDFGTVLLPGRIDIDCGTIV